MLISGSIGIINGAIFFFILKGLNIGLPYLNVGIEWLSVLIPVLVLLGIYIGFLLGKRLPIIFQAAKFFLVGTLNTLLDLGVLELLSWFFAIEKGVIVTVFKGISFLIATTNSYFWNKYWTFGKKKEMVRFGEYLKFLVVTAIGLLINTFSFHIAFNIIGSPLDFPLRIWRVVSVIIAAFFAFVWNFLSSKFLIFEKQKPV